MDLDFWDISGLEEQPVDIASPQIGVRRSREETEDYVIPANSNKKRRIQRVNLRSVLETYNLVTLSENSGGYEAERTRKYVEGFNEFMMRLPVFESLDSFGLADDRAVPKANFGDNEAAREDRRFKRLKRLYLIARSMDLPENLETMALPNQIKEDNITLQHIVNLDVSKLPSQMISNAWNRIRKWNIFDVDRHEVLKLYFKLFNAIPENNSIVTEDAVTLFAEDRTILKSFQAGERIPMTVIKQLNDRILSQSNRKQVNHQLSKWEYGLELVDVSKIQVLFNMIVWKSTMMESKAAAAAAAGAGSAASPRKAQVRVKNEHAVVKKCVLGELFKRNYPHLNATYCKELKAHLKSWLTNEKPIDEVKLEEIVLTFMDRDQEYVNRVLEIVSIKELTQANSKHLPRSLQIAFREMLLGWKASPSSLNPVLFTYIALYICAGSDRNKHLADRLAMFDSSDDPQVDYSEDEGDGGGDSDTVTSSITDCFSSSDASDSSEGSSEEEEEDDGILEVFTREKPRETIDLTADEQDEQDVEEDGGVEMEVAESESPPEALLDDKVIYQSICKDLLCNRRKKHLSQAINLRVSSRLRDWLFGGIPVDDSKLDEIILAVLNVMAVDADRVAAGMTLNELKMQVEMHAAATFYAVARSLIAAWQYGLKPFSAAKFVYILDRCGGSLVPSSNAPGTAVAEAVEVAAVRDDAATRAWKTLVTEVVNTAGKRHLTKAESKRVSALLNQYTRGEEVSSEEVDECVLSILNYAPELVEIVTEQVSVAELIEANRRIPAKKSRQSNAAVLQRMVDDPAAVRAAAMMVLFSRICIDLPEGSGASFKYNRELQQRVNDVMSAKRVEAEKVKLANSSQPMDDAAENASMQQEADPVLEIDRHICKYLLYTKKKHLTKEQRTDAYHRLSAWAEASTELDEEQVDKTILLVLNRTKRYVKHVRSCISLELLEDANSDHLCDEVRAVVSTVLEQWRYHGRVRRGHLMYVIERLCMNQRGRDANRALYDIIAKEEIAVTAAAAPSKVAPAGMGVLLHEQSSMDADPNDVGTVIADPVMGTAANDDVTTAAGCPMGCRHATATEINDVMCFVAFRRSKAHMTLESKRFCNAHLKKVNGKFPLVSEEAMDEILSLYFVQDEAFAKRVLQRVSLEYLLTLQPWQGRLNVMHTLLHRWQADRRSMSLPRFMFVVDNLALKEENPQLVELLDSLRSPQTDPSVMSYEKALQYICTDVRFNRKKQHIRKQERAEIMRAMEPWLSDGAIDDVLLDEVLLCVINTPRRHVDITDMSIAYIKALSSEHLSVPQRQVVAAVVKCWEDDEVPVRPGMYTFLVNYLQPAHADPQDRNGITEEGKKVGVDRADSDLERQQRETDGTDEEVEDCVYADHAEDEPNALLDDTALNLMICRDLQQVSKSHLTKQQKERVIYNLDSWVDGSKPVNEKTLDDIIRLLIDRDDAHIKRALDRVTIDDLLIASTFLLSDDSKKVVRTLLLSWKDETKDFNETRFVYVVERLCMRLKGAKMNSHLHARLTGKVEAEEQAKEASTPEKLPTTMTITAVFRYIGRDLVHCRPKNHLSKEEKESVTECYGSWSRGRLLDHDQLDQMILLVLELSKSSVARIRKNIELDALVDASLLIPQSLRDVIYTVAQWWREKTHPFSAAVFAYLLDRVCLRGGGQELNCELAKRLMACLEPTEVIGPAVSAATGEDSEGGSQSDEMCEGEGEDEGALEPADMVNRRIIFDLDRLPKKHLTKRQQERIVYVFAQWTLMRKPINETVLDELILCMLSRSDGFARYVVEHLGLGHLEAADRSHLSGAVKQVVDALLSQWKEGEGIITGGKYMYVIDKLCRLRQLPPADEEVNMDLREMVGQCEEAFKRQEEDEQLLEELDATDFSSLYAFICKDLLCNVNKQHLPGRRREEIDDQLLLWCEGIEAVNYEDLHEVILSVFNRADAQRKLVQKVISLEELIAADKSVLKAKTAKLVDLMLHGWRLHHKPLNSALFWYFVERLVLRGDSCKRNKELNKRVVELFKAFGKAKAAANSNNKKLFLNDLSDEEEHDLVSFRLKYSK